jgi:hypothetical protein
VLELAGAPEPPESVMGKSLLPLLKDPHAPHRHTVFSECVGVEGKPGEGHRMARGDRWKLILSDQNEEFLFDQQNDPFELNNRVADPELAPVLQRLRRELSQWMKKIGDRPYPFANKPNTGDGMNTSDFNPLDWRRPVDNPVFTSVFGNNHDSILFVEPELEYPYHLIISHTQEAAHLWRARKFSWSSADWELVSDQYKIGKHYEYDDGVKVDGTYYLYEEGIVYTFTGPLEEASGKWKAAGTFPHKQCDDIGVYFEDGVFHMFGEHGNFPHGPDGTSLAHFTSSTGLGDWKLVNAKAVDPNPDGGHTYGVGDATIARIEEDYYIFCDRESKGSPYKVVAWRSKDINAPFEYVGKAITPRRGEVDDWDNYRIQDPDIAYIPELGGYVMTCNMMDRDGNPGGHFPTLKGKSTRVIGVFYHGGILSEPPSHP